MDNGGGFVKKRKGIRRIDHMESIHVRGGKSNTMKTSEAIMKYW